MDSITLEEALAAATVDDSATDRTLVIDSDIRAITIPGAIKNLGVESDDDVHRLYFQMPKTYGEFDLYEFDIRINYKNGNVGDVYAVEDKTVEGDVITFSWLVGRNAVRTKGATQFIVCLKKSDSSGVVQQEFNTTVASLNVLEGLETTEQVVQENADIIEQILKKIDGLTSISPEDIATAVEEYMTSHPFAETDPTVSEWAKQPEKPNYTAEEVGALPNTTTTLPNPNALTFTGAATGSYDGSSPIEINIPEGGGTDVTVDTTLSVAGQAADAKATGDAISSLSEEMEQLKQTGAGLSTEAIDKLEEVGNYLVYTTANGGSKWTELIAILRNGSSGGGSSETVPATGITLDKTTLSFTGSTSQTLTATVEPSNSTDSVTWETSDAGVATVSSGVVSPVSNGSCTITAKAGSYSASCEVTVSVETEIVTYTITNNLTNVSTDNPVTTVNENSGYTANLTADTDYTIDSVTVTMGGFDVTSDVYTNGTIVISVVTGNVVITASAVQSGSTEEITLLKSITGDGASYIDTEFIMDSFDYRYEFDIQTNESSDFNKDYPKGYFFFGADMYNIGTAYHSVLGYLSGKTQLSFGVNGSNSNGGSWNIATFFADQIGYCVCKNGFAQVYTDAEHTTAPNWNSATTGASDDESKLPIIPLYLFAVNYNSGTNGGNVSQRGYNTPKKMTLYNFRVYQDSTNTLAHEFLPAKQGSKIGMYDTVTQKFHENKGSGIFSYEEVSA